MRNGYKTDYSYQKDFESLILKGTLDEIQDSLYYSVSPFKNKCKGLYLAAERGDISIFKELFKNRRFKKNSFDMMLFSKILFMNKNIELIKYLLEDKKEIDYNLTLRIQISEKTLFLSGFDNYIYQKDIDIDIDFIKYMLKNNNITYNIKFQFIKVIVDNNLIEVIDENFEKVLEYDSTNTQKFIKYSKEKNKTEILKRYLSIIKCEYQFKRVMQESQEGSKEDFILKIKNKYNDLKSLDMNLLNVAMTSENYQLIKKIYLKSKLNQKIESYKELVISKNKRKIKDVFNLYKNDKKFDLEEHAEFLIQYAAFSNNAYLLKLILSNIKRKDYSGKEIGHSIYNIESFNILIKDGRFNKDTKDLFAFQKVTLFNDIKKAKIIIDFENVIENINCGFLQEVYNEGKIDLVKLIASKKDFTIEKDYEKLKPELKKKIIISKNINSF